jgi:tetratricopeptide (TPR) repeat protein
MRYLRLFWTMIRAACGSPAAAHQLRRGMAALNAIDAVMTPYRKGDYQASLEAAEGFRYEGEVSASYCFYRGSNLAHLGRLQEAETWLRRNIEMRKKNETRHISIGYTTLGRLLLQAERHMEAIECFQSSIRTCPKRASGYRNLAEAHLLSGGDASEALSWARQAVEKGKADRELSPELLKLNLGESLATLAWAVAVDSHDAGEVARLVEEAVASIGTGTLSSTAQVLYQSGRAFAEVGDRERSAQYFEKTAALDVQGEFGRAARTAIEWGGAPPLCSPQRSHS